MAARAAIDPKISIVIPARNEARNLEAILPRLPEVHEVILVDGHSVDGTVEVARRTSPGIKVVGQTRRGKGNALACGFAAATGDIVVMLDADGSADPSRIPAFVEALLAGADVAKGTRYASGGDGEDVTRFGAFGGAALKSMTNRLLRTADTDLCSGFNAFWADIVPALQLPAVDLPARTDGRMEWGDGFEIETVLSCRLAAAGLRITEVPSIERPRILGRSTLDAVSDGLQVLRTILVEKRRSARAGLGRAGAGAASRATAA
jgi:glycosyltransferase involved in cell wall biosynthesis